MSEKILCLAMVIVFAVLSVVLAYNMVISLSQYEILESIVELLFALLFFRASVSSFDYLQKHKDELE